jgi:hypothetical protein
MRIWLTSLDCLSFHASINFVRRYNSYTIPAVPRFQYTVEVSASQGSVNKTLRLGPEVQSVADAQLGVQASILSKSFDLFSLPNLGQQRYLVSSGATPTRFVLPASTLCATSMSTNCIGMTASSFLYATKCASNLGQFTLVPGSLLSDQLSQFRSASLASKLQHLCSPAPAFTRDSTEAFTCAISKNIAVLLELYAASFQIRRLYGVPRVLSSGALPVDAGDQVLKLFTDVTNVGTFQAVFEMSVGECCVGAVGSMMSCSPSGIAKQFATFAQFATLRIAFPFSTPSGQRYGLSGSCTLAISQLGRVSLQTSFSFVTASTPPSVEETQTATSAALARVLASGAGACTLPLRLWRFGLVAYCVSPCSVDQVFDASTGVCLPVDCTAKYANRRNVFNAMTRACEAVAICTGSMVYVPASNACSAGGGTGATTPMPSLPGPTLSAPTLGPGIMPDDDTWKPLPAAGNGVGVDDSGVGRIDGALRQL